jgi:hypothetical protein
MESDPNVQSCISSFKVKEAILVSIICGMIISWTKFFKQERYPFKKTNLVFNYHEEALDNNKFNLKEQGFDEGDIRNVELNSDEGEETLKQENKILVERTNYSIKSGVLKGNNADRNLKELPTKGERGTSDYSSLSTEDVKKSQE